MVDRFSGFTYDGVHSSVMGVVLQREMVLSPPIPRIETITVPGRSGVLTRWDGSYEARTLSGDFYALSANVGADVQLVSRWLVGSLSPKRLIQDSDAQHYLLAVPTAGAQTALRLGLLAPFSLSFTCDPRRYLVWGDEEMDISAQRAIYNPTGFPSQPLLFVDGAGMVTITLGDSLSLLTVNVPEGGVWIDTQSAQAYNSNGSMNSLVEIDGDPVINSGWQQIDVRGDLRTLKIIPRWWEL